MPDIKKFKKGLSQDAFRAAYDEQLRNERGIFNVNDFNNSWLSYSSPLPKNSEGRTTTPSLIGGLTGTLSGLAEAGERQMSFPDSTVRLSEVINKTGSIIEKLTKLDFKGALGELGDTLQNQILTYYKEQNALLEKINRQAGLTGMFAENVREELTRTNPELALIGISFEELANSAKSVVDDSGRFLALNRTTWKETGLAASAYVGTLSDLVAMFPQFAKIGVGAGDVARQIEIVGKRSIELGLQSQKTTRELGTNLSKLNEYGFKNGIQGLAEMVRRSTELRMNMDTIFQVADKVFDPEGAIDLAANLQAIGGAIGDFNDPLKLMYMATNNVEGLGDALEGVAGSLATFNQEQGRFEITGVNLRRARALAKELGISYGELANTAIASAERTSAAADLMSKGFDLSEDQKRFITNISSMRDGKMQIELQSDKLQSIFKTDRIALEDLSREQVDQLMNLQKDFEKLDTEDIVKKQASEVENINRNLTFITAVTRQRAIGSGEAMLKKIAETFKIDLGDMIEKTEKKTQELGRTMLKPEGINKPTKTESEIKPTTKLREEDLKTAIDPLLAMYKATKEEPVKKEIAINITTPATILDPLRSSLLNDPVYMNSIKESTFNDRDYTSLA